MASWSTKPASSSPAARKSVQDHLQNDMNQAAEALDFERAALLRDRLSALALVQSQSDVAARGSRGGRRLRHRARGRPVLRAGLLLPRPPELGQPRLPPQGRSGLTDTEVLEAFIGQFYEDRTPPKLVLLSHEPTDTAVLEEALTSRLG